MDPTDTQANGTVAPQDEISQDTATTQGSEASESSVVTPEASQEVKDSGVNAEDTVQEKLFAGKYKTVEEMEKAYQELNSKFGQTTSEKAELTRLLNEAFLPPESGAQNSEIDDFPDEATASQDDSTKRDLAVIKFTIAHSDADGEAMKKILAEDPMMKFISGHEAKLEYAFVKSQSERQSQIVADATKKGQEQAQVKAAEKQIAQVESARKAEPVDEDSELRTQYMTGSPDERKAARLAAIRKNLVNL